MLIFVRYEIIIVYQRRGLFYNLFVMSKELWIRVFLLWVASVFLAIWFSVLYQSNMEPTNQEIKEDGKIAIKEDYSDLWINPNDYNSLGDYLAVAQTQSWKTVDIEKEDFVICKKDKDGSISYTPFYQNEIKWDYFNDISDKNAAIADIYQSLNEDCLFWWANSEHGTKILFEPDVAHPETYLLNKVISKKIAVDDLLTELKNTTKPSANKQELISYLHEFKWDYKNSFIQKRKLCLKDKDYCWKVKEFILSWIIKDENWETVKGADIVLLNDTKISTKSDKDWKFNLKFEYYPFSHLRFKFSKLWYSDWFHAESFNTYKDKNWIWLRNVSITLHTPENNYIVSKETNDYIVEKDGKKYYLFESEQSKYWVPVDGLYLMNGKKWQWNKFQVYLYEFKKTDNIADLMEVDTFNNFSGYVWNLMKTFWMPYIQFIDEDTNEEIFVHKSNPMILQNHIYHMKELYENYDKIYEALTVEDMEFLVKKSRELWWYPIDFEFLTKNDFLRWPAWWALDRKKWVWENIWAKVITTDGLIETPFYSINDMN